MSCGVGGRSHNAMKWLHKKRTGDDLFFPFTLCMCGKHWLMASDQPDDTPKKEEHYDEEEEMIGAGREDFLPHARGEDLLTHPACWNFSYRRRQALAERRRRIAQWTSPVQPQRVFAFDCHMCASLAEWSRPLFSLGGQVCDCGLVAFAELRNGRTSSDSAVLDRLAKCMSHVPSPERIEVCLSRALLAERSGRPGAALFAFVGIRGEVVFAVLSYASPTFIILALAASGSEPPHRLRHDHSITDASGASLSITRWSRSSERLIICVSDRPGSVRPAIGPFWLPAIVRKIT